VGRVGIGLTALSIGLCVGSYGGIELRVQKSLALRQLAKSELEEAERRDEARAEKARARLVEERRLCPPAASESAKTPLVPPVLDAAPVGPTRTTKPSLDLPFPQQWGAQTGAL
jgi:hypothetical protein